jgi:hypothetical protein
MTNDTKGRTEAPQTFTVTRADVIQFLVERARNGPNCSSCGGELWGIDMTNFRANLPVGGIETDSVITPRLVPTVWMTCNNCGMLRMHALSLIQRWKDERDKRATHSGEGKAGEVPDVPSADRPG